MVTLCYIHKKQEQWSTGKNIMWCICQYIENKVKGWNCGVYDSFSNIHKSEKCIECLITLQAYYECARGHNPNTCNSEFEEVSTELHCLEIDWMNCVVKR